MSTHSTYLVSYATIDCECNKTYKSGGGIVSQSYEMMKAYQCYECQHICDSERYMKIHILLEHPPHGYVSEGTEYTECQICGASVHYDIVKEHVELHIAYEFEGRDPMKCKYCAWKNDYMLGKTSCCVSNVRMKMAREHMLHHLVDIVRSSNCTHQRGQYE